MNAFIEFLNQRGGGFLEFAWPMLWQSSLLILILFAIDSVFRHKTRASIRYALWLVVLLKLCLPTTLALPTSPAWWLHKAPPPVVAKPSPQFTVTYDNDPLPEMPPARPPTLVPPRPAMTTAAWLVLTSAAVSSALLGWLLVRWWQITRQVRRAKTSGRLAALAGEAQDRVGTKFNLQVKLTANSISPAVCGLFRPAILIPQSLVDNFTTEQLRAVLLHELIHLRRRDVWLNFVQALLQIFYWWHPLVWLANARIRRVREEAVDDAVMLALRHEAESYAPTLLEVAKLALNRPLASLGLVGIMESRHALRQRIERLVDFRPPRQAGLTIVSLLGILAFTAVAVPMGGEPKSNENQSASARIASPSPSVQSKHPKTVMITSQFYWMTSDDFKKLAVRSSFLGQKQSTNSFWSLAPDKFSELMETLESLGLNSISSPRLGVIDGEQGEINIGNGTNSIELRCSPLVTGNSVRFIVEGKTIEGFVQGNPRFSITNVFGADAIAPNLGGIAIRSEPSSLNAESNLFVTIRAMIYTNAVDADKLVQDAKLDYEMGRLDDAENLLQIALSLDPRNNAAKYYLGLVQTARQTPRVIKASEGRQEIIRKLKTIRLDGVSFEALPLSEVTRTLHEESKRLDPDHRGINFMINPYLDRSGPQTIDPLTGLLATNSAVIDSDLTDIPITINPPLTNINLGDVLDALVMVAPKPMHYSVEDYAIVFSPGRPPTPLFSRHFRLDAHRFIGALHMKTGMQTNSVSEMARTYFSTLGLDWDSPKGKSIFYNDRLGELFVRATQLDLDLIERALSELNVGTEPVPTDPFWPPIRTNTQSANASGPQIHIKARFLEVSKNGFVDLKMSTNNLTGQMNGILTADNFNTIWRLLEAKPGSEVLAEPEVVTITGRHTQMRSTILQTIITNFVFQETSTNASIVPQTEDVETGPVLDVVPRVLSDGYTINLTLIPSFVEMLGYDTPTNTAVVYNHAGEKVDVPKALPRFTIHQVTVTANLWDDQTVILGGLPEKDYVSGKETVVKPKSSDKELLIFITATLVDRAGNRLHSDEEMSFARNAIPPQ